MEGSALLERPPELKHGKTSIEELVPTARKLYENAQGREEFEGLSLEQVVDKLIATKGSEEIATVLAPLLFTEPAQQYLLGVGHKPVTDETFSHILEYVGTNTDPSIRPVVLAAVMEFAKKIWGSDARQHQIELLAIIFRGYSQGQKIVARNGHSR